MKDIKNKNKNKEVKDNVLFSRDRNDTIFIGLEFGMSQKQYNAYIEKLIINKSIFLEDNYPVYLLELREREIFRSKLIPAFYNDSLVTLEVYFNYGKPYGPVFKDKRKYLFDFFIEKYGNNFSEGKYEFQKDTYIGQVLTWTHNNREVKLILTDFITSANYTDTSKSNKMLKEKQKKTNKIN